MPALYQVVYYWLASAPGGPAQGSRSITSTPSMMDKLEARL